MGYTPGPWKVFESHLHTLLVCTNDHRGAIICDFDRNNRVDNESNARLISAAPELLKACKFALDTVTLAEDLQDWDPVIDALKAAIAKAEEK